MATPAFTLSVPADEPFRDLAAAAVRTYLRTSRRDESPAADAFAESVGQAVDRLAAEGADIGLVVTASPARVQVEVTCSRASETLSFRS